MISQPAKGPNILMTGFLRFPHKPGLEQSRNFSILTSTTFRSGKWRYLC